MLIVHWGSTGAGPRITFDLARELATQPGMDVSVSYSTLSDAAQRMAGLGLKSVAFPTYRSELGVILGLPRMVYQAVRLRRFIRAHDVDAVFSPMESLWQSLGLRLFLSSKVHYLSTIHDADAHPGDQHWLRDACRRIELARADTVVTFSESVRTALTSRIRTTASVVSTVHGAFSRDDAVSATPRSMDTGRPVIVGFFGRLLRYKGLDLYVETIRALVARGVDVHGVVHGAGDVVDLIAASVDLPITWNVGWVSPDCVNDVVASMDLLLLPYVEASQSGAFAVALAEGVPVVATPVGGLAEQVRHSGAGAVAQSVTGSALADEIVALVSDEPRYAGMSEAGLVMAAGELSWERVAADVRRFAEEGLVATGRRGAARP